MTASINSVVLLLHPAFGLALLEYKEWRYPLISLSLNCSATIIVRIVAVSYNSSLIGYKHGRRLEFRGDQKIHILIFFIFPEKFSNDFLLDQTR